MKASRRPDGLAIRDGAMRIRGQWSVAWMMTPVAIIFTLLFILPSLNYFVLSFWRVAAFRVVPDFSFANYARALGQHLPVLLYTFKLALLTAVTTTVLGFLLAYVIRFRAGRLAPFLLLVTLLTLFGGYLMKVYAWKTILGNEGVINTALLGLGLIDQPITSLFYSPGAVVVTLVHFLLPFAVLPIFSSLRGVEEAEIESARDLGASGWRVVSDILVPRCRTGILAAFSLCFLAAVGDYVTPAIVGGTISMFGRIIESQFGQAFNAPLGAALSFVMLFASALVLITAGLLLRLWRPR